ncbi:hypothetical protein THSYN_06070 [Candidatus Thiodictyon syntrophicum]|jgi:hypothetical protein|uniref:Uncharacterized protein n=2 Tax=Candidatus Thiodictyon syntrophicum TaxID=1166950 RepID=A0A2K8U4Q1_9GAMM|nr:hypothetical protein THSYN_06070 [Candidatus Thiodictyon syntrophicum]
MDNSPSFELRIIRVAWAKQDIPLAVEVAQYPIPLQPDGTGWIAEIAAYPVLPSAGGGQLAVQLPPGAPAPVLIAADDRPVPMVPIRAPDGPEWWIEKGKWRNAKNGNYHDAPLCRHAGDARLQVGDDRIRLQVYAPGFEGGDFDALLDEFRNGAWQLILEPSSPTRGTDRRADGGVDPVFLEAVSAFIRYAGRALDQPHRELREVRELQPIERVRPHTGTFRELATRGAPRRVSGRGHVASFDTPENRQLLAMCGRLGRTLRALNAGAQGAASDFIRRALADDDRTRLMTDTLGRSKVDARGLERFIAELESRLGLYGVAKNQLLIGSGSAQGAELLVIDNPMVDAARGKPGFWGIGVWGHGKRERVRLNFSSDTGTLASVFWKKNPYGKRNCYRLSGGFQHVNHGQSDAGDWSIWEVRFLNSIESDLEPGLRGEIDSLRGRQASLAQRDFLEFLNRRDAQDQSRDIEEAQRSAERLRAASAIWHGMVEQLTPLAHQVSTLETRAKKLSVRTARHSAFTGSMTYVLNPDYRAALGAYRRALDAAGLTSSQLDGLLRLEDLGILDLPTIYERWCLLRIVAVLREHFHLTPPADFRDRLLGCVTGQGTLSLRFAGPATGRDLLFEYQSGLPRTDRPESQWPRPDFALTVLPHSGWDTDTEPWSGNRWDADASAHPRLILDAKCKPFGWIGDKGAGPSLIDELDELIARRGYREPGDNRVFVLHPGRGADSGAAGSAYCHYGGAHLVPEAETRPVWDQENPDHRHGAVLLRPGVSDPLARLILMHLYLGLDDSLGAYDNRSPRYPLICPACGGTEMMDRPPPGTPETDRPGRACWCRACGRMLVWNVSAGCGTHLFKLGGYWTFHETHPLDPYNICCPHCGDYMPIASEDPGPDEFDRRYDQRKPPWPR